MLTVDVLPKKSMLVGNKKWHSRDEISDYARVFNSYNYCVTSLSLVSSETRSMSAPSACSFRWKFK